MCIRDSVYIEPGDKAAKDRLAELPVFVPASDLDKVKQEAAAARAAEITAQKAEETKAEQYRGQYPGMLHFDYTWDKTKGKTLGLEQIWRDDRFTSVSYTHLDVYKRQAILRRSTRAPAPKPRTPASMT